AGAELHTSFRLDSSGEFLSLVDPQGREVLPFAPEFPRQRADISFGLPMEIDRSERPVLEGATARYVVPQDGSLGLSWTEPDFDDSLWAAGSTGIGYDRQDPPRFADLIATDVETAMYDVNPGLYVRIPFVLADAGSVRFLRLRIKYEDGYVAYINGQEVGRGNAPAGDVAFDADALTARSVSLALAFENADIAVPAGLLRAGANVLAIHGLNRLRSSSDFLLLPELDVIRVGEVNTGELEYFVVPTPGFPNAEGLEGVAPPPAFSRVGAAYPSAFSLELSTSLSPAVIRYTLDGSEPVESSPAYSGPISISARTTVKARVYSEQLLPSETAHHDYVFVHSSAAGFESNLPILIAEPSGSVNETTYRAGYFAVIDNGDGRNRMTDPFAIGGPGGFKYRGSSSLGFPKKNFNMETWEAYGRDVDTAVPLLGMPRESDWVLHGPYSDKSLMRNDLSYLWSNYIERYAPRTRFVELFYKTSGTTVASSHYWGVYLVVEKIKVDGQRVDIEKLLPTDSAEPEITGGYLLKKDRLDPGDSGFRTSRGQVLAFVEPKEAEITSAQRSYITSYMNQFEAALYGSNFQHPELGYARYIDVDSFIDHHIITELCKNIDGYRLSTFFYKDRGGKLTMGPIWDYNLSLGNANYLAGGSPTGWYYPQLSSGDYPWYPRLHQDPAYLARYRERWLLHRGSGLATPRLYASVDANVELLAEAQERNFQKWRILGTYIWPNQFIAATWEEEIDWMRNYWLAGRLAWMDTQLGIHPPLLDRPSGLVPDGFELGVTSRVGDAYYTLNGPDPMQEDGSPHPLAQPYTAPIPITENTKVQVRSRFGESGWTDMVAGTYVTDAIPLVVTEIMYYPVPPEGSEFSSSAFEFLEFQNVGEETISLAGMRFSGRPVFDFSTSAVTDLGPGEFVVVCNKLEAFAERYSTEGIRIAGQFESGLLSNSGQKIELLGPLDAPIISFTYDDAWYPETDGGGYSLVIRDARADPSTWDDPASWRASLEIGGSPGREDTLEPRGGLRVPSDIVEDGDLNISDAVGLLGFLFRGQPAALPCGDGSLSDPANQMLLDANGDLSVNLSDAVYVLGYLFSGGPAPVLGAACVEIEGCTDLCPHGP
ncbi:MAG: CotH kinase family protein, partial [Planctomycetes bacterium]|nr:CotH kinase family protein [Planctomycetota bacterium]